MRVERSLVRKLVITGSVVMIVQAIAATFSMTRGWWDVALPGAFSVLVWINVVGFSMVLNAIERGRGAK